MSQVTSPRTPPSSGGPTSPTLYFRNWRIGGNSSASIAALQRSLYSFAASRRDSAFFFGFFFFFGSLSVVPPEGGSFGLALSPQHDETCVPITSISVQAPSPSSIQAG